MEIRWQYVDSNPEIGRTRTYLSAKLIKQRRTKEGGGSLVVAELASIDLRFLSVNVAATRRFARGLFWAKLESRLNQLSLTTAERAALENEVVQKVPKPKGQWPLWGVTCVPGYDC